MKLRNWIGIFIVVFSLSLMYLWESGWREKILYVNVCVAARDISEGEPFSEECWKIVSLPPQVLIKDSLNPESISILNGLCASSEIFENQQLSASCFEEERKIAKDGCSYFVLPDSWIYSRSGALSEGDFIDIYSLAEGSKLGSFSTAFVREDSVEIICRLNEYLQILDSVNENGMASLLLVMEDI